MWEHRRVHGPFVGPASICASLSARIVWLNWNFIVRVPGSLSWYASMAIGRRRDVEFGASHELEVVSWVQDRCLLKPVKLLDSCT